MSAAFPRGGLKSDETKEPKQEKKEKRKRKENDADLLATRKPAKTVKAPTNEPVEQQQQSTPLDVLTTTTIVKAARGKPAKLRPVRFASYHAETTVLGVVRSTSTKHALVSLPGNLVGHVDVSGALQLTPNTVVRCAVLSTSRAGAAPGSKKGPKRVELAIDARGVQKGLRLEDIASNRVTTLFGLVASREARGYVVDVGVGGATGFLAFKHCQEDIRVGAPVECRVLKLDPDSGVCALTTKDVASSKNAPEKTGWSFRALCVGQRVRACVHRRVATGLVVTFADGALAGVIERDHLGSKGSLVDDEAFMNLDEFGVGQFLDARVLLIDRAAKVARLTCAEHLLDLTGASLPSPGAFLKGCSVVRKDPKVGLVLRKGDQGIFVHKSRLPEEDLESTTVDCRVVGVAPLEGWALASMTPSALDPEVPVSKSELQPGTIINATVLSTQAWGLEVRLSETLTGQITNLHVTESGGSVDPRKHRKVGDEIKCRVLRVEARRIELTSKKSLVKAARVLTSYDDAAANCGRSFAGFVTGADAARGLVVTFFGNVQGRVDPASLRARGIVDPSQSFALGTVITCCVKGVTTPKVRQDGTSRKPRIALTLDDVDGCKVEVDSVLKAVAVELVEARAKGASKRAPRKAVACLCRVTSSKGECLAKLPVAHACDHGLEAESTLRRLASTGETFECRVLEAATDGAPAKISAAPSMINATKGKLELDAIRTGVVVQLKPYGAFVSFGGQERGLIPRALVADRYIGDLEDCFRVGDVVRCAVDSIEGDRVVLRTRGVPRDETGAFGRSVLRSLSGNDSLRVGFAYDALVASSDDGVRFSQINGIECRGLAPLKHSLKCSEGDVVKIRLMGFRKDQALCSMVPDVVRPGRTKRRAKALQVLTEGASIEACDLLDKAFSQPTIKGAGIYIDRGTGQLICVQRGDFHRRDEDVRPQVEEDLVVVSSAVDELYGLVVAVPREDPRSNEQVRHRRGSVATDAKAEVARKRKLPKTDLSALDPGDALTCRVAARGSTSEALLLTIRGGEGRVRCRLHVSDALTRPACRAPEASTDVAVPGLPEQHPFHGIRCGSAFDGVLLQRTIDGEVTRVDIGVGTTHVGRKAEWGSSITSASIISNKDDFGFVTVCAAPSVRAKVAFADVVESFLSNSDLDAAITSATDACAASTRLRVVKTKNGATCRLDKDKIRPVQAGDIVPCVPSKKPEEKRRGAARCGAMDRRYVLPTGLEAFCSASEFSDRDAWTDCDNDSSIALCVVLEAGPPARISLRPSRVTSGNIKPDEALEVGRVRPGFVVGADAKAGVFVELARGIIGRVLLKDLADGYVKDVVREFPLGRLVAPVVTQTTPKVELSLRPSAIKRESSIPKIMKENDVVKGTITRVEAYGVFVRIDDAPSDAPSGLAHKSELSDDFVKDVSSRFAKGDRVVAKVLKIESGEGRRKVSLGLKPSYFTAAMEEDEEEEEEEEDNDDEALARADALLANDSDSDSDDDVVEDEAADSSSEEEEEDEDSDDESDDDDEEEAQALRWDEEQPKQTKRRKTEPADEGAAELQTMASEEALLNDEMRSSDDYERHLVAHQDEASAYTTYATFLLEREDDAPGARKVLERGLKTIHYRQEDQRLDVWACLLELERKHGDSTSLDATTKRAVANCDPTKVLLRLGGLLDAAQDFKRSDAVYRKCEKRAKHQAKTTEEVWLRHARSRLLAGDAKGADDVVKRGVQACDGAPKEEASLLSRYACLELEDGSRDRGRTVFDKLLERFPRRADLWQLYVVKTLKAGDVAHARLIQTRLASVDLPPKMMNAALKRFAAFESEHGDAASAAAVKDLARAYVARRKDAMDEDDD